ncbi:unnamed protein product [Rotaria sp. Silwood2]|nr:unnamed protein product [Rotaria sp. Silwood2]
MSVSFIRPSISYLSFQSLCDNFIDHTRIDQFNYTDETECQDWPCSNAYTRCNRKWNCHNAADETNCPDNPCRPNGHPCISILTRNFTCLPLSRINDGIVDCAGGYDEQNRCEQIPNSSIQLTYRCFNETQCVQREVHIIFVEFHQHYYLALLQTNSSLPWKFSTRIIPQHRCLSIREVFPNHIQSLSRWHHAKQYHIPCQKRSNVTCFYDDDYFMCLCNMDRHANCFKFDFSHIYDCFGYNYYENEGRCFVDNRTCPTASSCLCKECYFGSRCQFTTNGFGLSLDIILGYSIQPKVHFLQQPNTVKISTAVTAVVFVIGLINGILCVITFKTKESLAVGSGLYLLAASITYFVAILLFALKFLFLILSQMAIITNQSFLSSICVYMDMLLKSFLAVGEWLTAFVHIERMWTIKCGVKFNKQKSKRIAKNIIFGIFILTFLSFIHDPIRRSLLKDTEEERTWCVIRYSSSMQTYASFINILHFLLPLCINFISTIMIIVLIAREKLRTRRETTYQEHI